MFNQLVESGSHRADFARRGTFFVSTLALYAVLFVIAGVASVYAYDAKLDKQNLELFALVSPAPLPVQIMPQNNTPHPAGAPMHNNVIERTTLYAPLKNSTKPPDSIAVKPNTAPELSRYDNVMASNWNTGGDERIGGPIGPSAPGIVASSTQPRIVVAEGVDVAPPAPPTPAPKHVPTQVRLPSSVISSKVLSKPVPAYPIIAKQVRASGSVTIEILVDEQGRVISAQATSGHPLLREAARQAALQARFSPTVLSNQPVKVSGVITYNFVLQ